MALKGFYECTTNSNAYINITDKSCTFNIVYSTEINRFVSGVTANFGGELSNKKFHASFAAYSVVKSNGTFVSSGTDLHVEGTYISGSDKISIGSYDYIKSTKKEEDFHDKE